MVDMAHADPAHLAQTRGEARSAVPRMRAQALACAQVLQMFRNGVLLVDEVDLVLHPLRSELNFPVGNKDALDLTLGKTKKGMRWEMQFFLLDPVSIRAQMNITNLIFSIYFMRWREN